MERTVLRILGKKGRTTIPWPIRAELDFCPGDVLLFEADPPGRVVITRLEVVEPEEVEEPDCPLPAKIDRKKVKKTE